MEETNIKLLMKEFVNHDVIRFVFEKPSGLIFTPGQATELSISGEEDSWRPFTFASSPEDLVLEFIIKIYPEHGGVTEKLSKLIPGDEVRIKDIFGSIKYEDKGVFIAGGAGITPFIPILRNLKKKEKMQGNRLIFSNKTSKDVIIEKELREIFSKEDLVLTLTQEESKEGFEFGKIDEKFIEKHVKDFGQKFYICGPPRFTKDIRGILEDKGAKPDSLIFEGKK